MNKLKALLVACMAAFPSTAHAQAYQCRIPQEPVSVPATPRDGPVRRLPVASYTLALSWVPEYCRGKEASAADRFECSGVLGRFGLVLHGLWPESRYGPWPQWCPTPITPASAQIRANLCMTPSAELLAHEWAKHGACMAKSPEAYYALARKLWEGLTLPDLDLLSRRNGLNAGMVRQGFVDANPQLSANGVGLLVSERGWLKEVRLCFDRGFKSRRCAKDRYGPSDAAALKIWRGL